MLLRSLPRRRVSKQPLLRQFLSTPDPMATAVPQEAAKEFVDYVNASPSPFHAVSVAVDMLEAAGYERLREREDWSGRVHPGGRYYVTRNQTSMVAFAVGGAYEPGNGFCVVAAHTDSPCLKIKPISDRTGGGFRQVGVETYGGGLWHTWFDRDLTVAGRVIVRNGDRFEGRTVHIERPIMRIPNLAIHLNREVAQGFKYNKETHLTPILATAVREQLEGIAPSHVDVDSAAGRASSVHTRHAPALIAALAEEMGVEVEAIEDFELVLCDTQPAAVGGVHREFVFAPRLDNLLMSFTAIRALLDSQESLAADRDVRAAALFDNEEVGSNSVPGAGSTLMREVMERVSGLERFPSAARRSLLISADMAHALHPNYREKHESLHQPAIHGGVVIKHNANQRYATNAVTATLLRKVAERRGLPLQEFVIRQDQGCGSTIGPILATSCGVRTVDVGVPQWSMHSIRESCGTDDIHHAIELFKGTFEDYADLDEAMADVGDA